MDEPDVFDSTTDRGLPDGARKRIFTLEYRPWRGPIETDDGRTLAYTTEPAEDLKDEVEDFLDDHRLLDYSFRLSGEKDVLYEVKVTYLKDETDDIELERIAELQNQEMSSYRKDGPDEEPEDARSRFNQRLDTFLEEHDVYDVDLSAVTHHKNDHLYEAWIAYRPDD